MKKTWQILKNIILENGLIYYNSNNLSLIEYLKKKKYIIILILSISLLFSFKITILMIVGVLILGFIGKLLFKIMNLENNNNNKNQRSFKLGK
jgi:hypothetical protein